MSRDNKVVSNTSQAPVAYTVPSLQMVISPPIVPLYFAPFLTGNLSLPCELERQNLIRRVEDREKKITKLKKQVTSLRFKKEQLVNYIDQINRVMLGNTHLDISNMQLRHENTIFFLNLLQAKDCQIQQLKQQLAGQSGLIEGLSSLPPLIPPQRVIPVVAEERKSRKRKINALSVESNSVASLTSLRSMLLVTQSSSSSSLSSSSDTSTMPKLEL